MKKFIYSIVFLLIVFLGYEVFVFFSKPDRELNFNNSSKPVILNDDGFFYNAQTSALTIEDFLKEKAISLGEHDRIFPELPSPLFFGATIFIKRALKMKVLIDGKTSEFYALENSVAGALQENDIRLGEDDFTKPELNSKLQNNIFIEVVRVEVKEEIVKKEIPFKIKENEDADLSWRTKKITQKGEKGIKEVTYKIVSHNSKEISRKILEEETIKEPVTEIVSQGTYVKIGKTHTGVASWYAFRGGMYAANPWLPMGSYVRVTNNENGKQAIVQINDRGPFGNGRIIDLDKIAFAKIANLGAGLVNVKMEVIVN
jgi:uncharacterized protein YabE (DUF348 family)